MMCTTRVQQLLCDLFTEVYSRSMYDLKISHIYRLKEGLIAPITGHLPRMRVTLPTRGMSTSTMAMTIGTIRQTQISCVVCVSRDNNYV